MYREAPGDYLAQPASGYLCVDPRPHRFAVAQNGARQDCVIQRRSSIRGGRQGWPRGKEATGNLAVIILDVLRKFEGSAGTRDEGPGICIRPLYPVPREHTKNFGNPFVRLSVSTSDLGCYLLIEYFLKFHSSRRLQDSAAGCPQTWGAFQKHVEGEGCRLQGGKEISRCSFLTFEAPWYLIGDCRCGCRGLPPPLKAQLNPDS